MGLVVKQQLQYQLSFQIISKKKILNKFLINFSKNPKKRCFGANLCPFCSNLVKNEFSWKKKFKYSSCLPSCQKSKKKLMSLRKMLELMDDQTDRQTDRQQWFCRPSTTQKLLNHKTTLSFFIRTSKFCLRLGVLNFFFFFSHF